MGNGKGIKRTPAQLERQEKIFDLSVVHGLTVRQICALLKVSPQTVVADLREEEQRRSAEIAERRDEEKARSVSFYAAIARKAIHLAENPKMPGDSARFSDAIKARERIDKIMGIDAPTRVEVGMAGLIDALNE